MDHLAGWIADRLAFYEWRRDFVLMISNATTGPDNFFRAKNVLSRPWEALYMELIFAVERGQVEAVGRCNNRDVQVRVCLDPRYGPDKTFEIWGMDAINLKLRTSPYLYARVVRR